MKKDKLLCNIKNKCLNYFDKFCLTVFPDSSVRNFIYFLKSYYKENKDLVGCEIGVMMAYNAENMMQYLSLKKLYLIDPYNKYIQENQQWDTSIRNMEQKSHKRMKKYGNRICWIKNYSELCVDEIPNELDFLYIDGNHNYENAKQDLNLYYNKVKHKGIVGGDDFNLTYPGVIKAVCEFVKNNNITLLGNGQEWWFIKP